MTIDALEFLRAAARAGHRTNNQRLPEDGLIFELDYPKRPDLNKERKKLEDLLDGDGFDVWTFDEETDPSILVLRFARVRRQQSTSFLFSVCRYLERELGLEEAAPQIDPAWTDTETGPAGTEGVGDAIFQRCRSQAASPSDPDWARKLVRADKAQSSFGLSGSGIRVGQPDTGVARHLEIERGVRSDLGWDFVSDQPDPRDPLTPSMRSPGHGTATSGCVISRADLVITGTAPGAELVPVRCVDSVIIGSGTAVAKAIDHARKNGCHIITMSLGGPFGSPSLRRAIVRAAKAGIIMLAAAGNCVGLVVYPARDRNVLAIAGVDRNMKRWKGSSRGSSIAFSAPGENVHVARRNPLPPSSSPNPDNFKRIDVTGQGTSYAVATVAGCAALWLERYGVKAVRDIARKRNISINDLFSAAVAQTAQRPSGWNSSKMGSGVIDAHALCRLDPNLVGTVPETISESPALLSFGESFDGPLAAEANVVATDWSLREWPDATGTVESVTAAMPSPELMAKIGRDSPRSISQTANLMDAAPALILQPQTPPLPPEDVMRTLAAAVRHDGHAAPMDVAAAIDSIQPNDVNAIMDRVVAVMGDEPNEGAPPFDEGEEEQAIQDIDRTLRAVARARPSDFDDLSNFMLGPLPEAIIELTGRPVIAVGLNGQKNWTGSVNDAVLTGPRAGDWSADLFGRRKQWRPLVNAVGRIDVKGLAGWRHGGTGYLVGPDLVLTNRHVAQAFAEPLPTGPGSDRLAMTREASIIFDSAAKDEGTRFTVIAVENAGSERIGRFVDPSLLDVALLRIDPASGTHALPDPIAFNPITTDDPSREFILVAGYPARTTAASAPADAALRPKYFDRLMELYGSRYGVKYISPGQITKRPGVVPGDRRDWSFAHDASTLGGNSGSLVLTLDDEMALCGIHFGGATMSMNLAHDLEAVAAIGDSGFDLSALVGV